jgi:hypothetical protein
LRETGNVSASKGSHRQSPLEQHAAWLLGLIAEEPDLTLQDVQMLLLREKRSRSALARSGDFMIATASGSGSSLRAAEDLHKRLPWVLSLNKS